jgi:uncharacterized protein (DUF1800 family)
MPSPRAPLLPALLALALAACGGGGGSDVGASPPTSAYGSMAVKGAYTATDVRHFLRRTHWAVTDDKRQRIAEVGLGNFLDEMLDFPPVGSTPWEQDADRLLADPDDPPGQEGLFPSRQDLMDWAVELMCTNPNPFQEVLAFFWHDHFATSSEVLDGGSLHWMKDHIDLFRAEGAGNVKQMVLDVSRDPAMLQWLDGVSSTRRAPNENYAREFLELFCLGVDNGYTQEDIVEASRAFTGYRRVTLDQDTGLRGVVFDPERHDTEDKVVFGATIPGQDQTDDYQAMVDATFDNRPAAEWFARSLLAYFCYEDPPQSVIDQLAQLLRDSDYELRPVLRRLFLSEAFYSPRAEEGFVKSPVEFLVGFIRATGLPPVDRETGKISARSIRVELDGLAQVPTAPPNVSGWPTGVLWLSAQGMVNRANAVRTLIVDRADQEAAGYFAGALIPSGTPTTGEIIDAVAARLSVELSSEERDTLVHYLDTERQGDGTDVDDPFDPANERHVDERLRGLLYILAQHPTAMIR